MMNENLYNPDVLDTLANLSSDEVFTPPKLANEILDLLPKTLWSNKNAKFLDPVSKEGVFLREITKRLDAGLADQITDKQERINHILTKQVFGIAITELTSLISRRSVYCSKVANSKYSICTDFTDKNGKIYFRVIKHSWKNGRCIHCGANRKSYKRGSEYETHAYQFIHNEIPKEILNMKFDVIIGNPPYQMSDGGAQASAVPLYHKFVQQAKKLNPRYLTMIIPSRWFSGGRGLESFRKEMLNDDRLRKIIDFPNSKDCFPGVEIKGGVNYFLWDKEYKGNCEISRIEGNKLVSKMTRPLVEPGLDIFIRYNESIAIYRKVSGNTNNSFAKYVSSQKPFGLRTYVKGKESRFENDVKLYGNKRVSWFPRDDIEYKNEWIDKWKVLITMAYGAGEGFPHQIINKPIIAEPNSICTETYLVVGPFNSEIQARNVKIYMETKFFRFLVMLKKITQHASRKVYAIVPEQDFSIEWTDEKLYEKYQLNNQEIEFIESMIKPIPKTEGE